MSYETLIVERRGHVLRVTLNRPAALNAMSRPLVRELRVLFGGLAEDRETRASSTSCRAWSGPRWRPNCC